MRWEEIYKRLPKDRAITGAEIGVWTGKTSSYLLEHLPNLTLYMIDAWADPATIPSFFNSGAKMARFDKSVYDSAFATVQQIQLKYPDRSFIIKDVSLRASWRFNYDTLDFVFLDGDHSAEGLSLDMDLWYPKVKLGGLFCGHDYNPADKGFRGVKKAVNEWFEPDEFELGDDHTWFHIKK